MDTYTFWNIQQTANSSDYNELEMENRKYFNEIIVPKWGHSSCELKHWLNNECNKNYKSPAKFDCINVDAILPPLRKGKFWYGQAGLKRLKMALNAKSIVILNTFDTLDYCLKVFKIEALRLWLRIDSIKTSFSIEQFMNMTNECWNYTVNNYNEAYQNAVEDTEKYNESSYKKTMYHYKKEDFDGITPDMKLGEAYDYWTKYVFDGLLDKYKQEQLAELKIKIMRLKSQDYKEDLTDKYFNMYNEEKALIELRADRLKMNKPNKNIFKKMLNKFKIEYMKKK